MRDPLHLQREIGDTAAAMLAGSISFIAGARHICTICFEAGLEKDPDILRLRGIDSETDSLPLVRPQGRNGPKKHWQVSPATLSEHRAGLAKSARKLVGTLSVDISSPTAPGPTWHASAAHDPERVGPAYALRRLIPTDCHRPARPSPAPAPKAGISFVVNNPTS